MLEEAGMKRTIPLHSLGLWPARARLSRPDPMSPFSCPNRQMPGQLSQTQRHKNLEGGEGPSPVVPAGSPQSGPVPGSSGLLLVAPPALWYSQEVVHTHPAGN